MAWSLTSKTPHLNLVTRPNQHKCVNPDMPQELSICSSRALHSTGRTDGLTKLRGSERLGSEVLAHQVCLPSGTSHPRETHPLEERI